MILPFKKLYFVWFRFGGGATAGCYQPWLACHEMGIPAGVLSAVELVKNISSIRDSAIFIMKERVNQKLIDVLRNNNNTVIRYAGDGVELEERKYFKRIKNLNGVIVGSNEYRDIVEGNCENTLAAVIPANRDMFLDRETYSDHRNKSFKLYFGGKRAVGGVNDGFLIQGDLGLKDSFDYEEGYFHSLKYVAENMKNLPSREVEKYVLDIAKKGLCKSLEDLKTSYENPSKYSCHYAVRAPFAKSSDGKVYKEYDQWNTKTGGKVSTAAASGANIVTSLDPSVRVLIDENYPYAIDTTTDYFRDNHDEICKEMVIKARETFDTKIWHDGLSILESVRERTEIKNIVSEYVDFIKRFYE